MMGDCLLLRERWDFFAKSGMINFDFTDLEVGDGTYGLINAAGGFSLNGTPDDDLAMGFGIVVRVGV